MPRIDRGEIDHYWTLRNLGTKGGCSPARRDPSTLRNTPADIALAGCPRTSMLGHSSDASSAEKDECRSEISREHRLAASRPDESAVALSKECRKNATRHRDASFDQYSDTRRE